MKKALIAGAAALSAIAWTASPAFAQRFGDRAEHQNEDHGGRGDRGRWDNADAEPPPPEESRPVQPPATPTPGAAERNWGGRGGSQGGSEDNAARFRGPSPGGPPPEGPREWRPRDDNNGPRPGLESPPSHPRDFQQPGGPGNGPGDWRGRQRGGSDGPRPGWNGPGSGGEHPRDWTRDGGHDSDGPPPGDDFGSRRRDWNRGGGGQDGNGPPPVARPHDGDWNRNGRPRDGDWNHRPPGDVFGGHPRDGGDGDRRPQEDWNGRPGDDHGRDGNWNGDRRRDGDRHGPPRDWRHDDHGRDWQHWDWNRNDNRYSRWRHTHRDFDRPRYNDWRRIRHGYYFDYGYAQILRLYWGHPYYWWSYDGWRRPHRDWRVGYYLPDWIWWEPLPWDLYYRLPPAPYGCRYIMVDRDILLISLTTGMVLDALYYGDY